MPSSFETLFAGAALPAMFDSFGQAGTYTAPNGVATSTGMDGAPLLIRVQRGEMRPLLRDNRANGEIQTAELLVRQSQLVPVKGGRFKVNDVELWTIANTPTLKNGEYVCTCSRQGIERLADRRAKE